MHWPSDGVEVILGAENQPIANQGRRCQSHFVQVVRIQQLVFLAGTNHKCFALLVQTEDLASVAPGLEGAHEKGTNLVPLPSQVREFIRASKAESTLRGYQSDWRNFVEWAQARQTSPLPAAPETVAAYIAGCASRLKVGSIQRRLNAIAEAHKAVGLESPSSAGMVRNTLKGIKRTIGTAAVQKAPTLTEDIRAMVDATDTSLIGARDRALVLLGFAGAFRRSELIGLDIADLDFGRDGLTVMLRRSKVDQDGAGRKVGIPYGSNPETCPVRSLQAWIEQAAIADGLLFRSINRHGKVQPSRLSGIDV